MRPQEYGIGYREIVRARRAVPDRVGARHVAPVYGVTNNQKSKISRVVDPVLRGRLIRRLAREKIQNQCKYKFQITNYE